MTSIIRHPDDRLRVKCAPFVVETEDDRRNLGDLIKTLCRLGYESNALGLAAPQIGVAKRVIVARWTTALEFRVMVNPEIVEIDGPFETAAERCLSVDFERRVSRARCVTVRCMGGTVASFRGLMARVVQHEIDHLDGVLIVDKEAP